MEFKLIPEILKLKRFFFGELAFSGKLPPSCLPHFQKAKMGEAGGGLSLIHTLINFHFRILGNK